jgi:hypothetical protein
MKYFINQIVNTLPGPGNYDQRPLICTKGKLNFNSKYETGPAVSIAQRYKQSSSAFLANDSKYYKLILDPGPGSYKLPSEWGQYESSKAKEFDQWVESKILEKKQKDEETKKH